MSLKSDIEEYLANAISAIAAAGSPTVSPELMPDEELINATGGALPYDRELTEGPLVRLMILNLIPLEEEFGNEELHASTLAQQIQVVGISGIYNDLALAAKASSNTEEIIRLHLQHLKFNIEWQGENGRYSYASILIWGGTSFENIIASAGQISPQVYAPIPVAGNSNHVILTTGTGHSYMGLQPATITVEVVTPNIKPGIVDGLTFRYKFDAGAWQGPLSASVVENVLQEEVAIRWTIPGIAVAGDSWTIQALPASQQNVGVWTQNWTMKSEAVAVY